MRKNENIQTLGITADLMNTLAGGMSEPVVNVTKASDAHHLIVKVPGVNPASLDVQVAFNRLHIQHTLAIESGGTKVAVPRVIFSKPVPYFINADKIEATADGGVLRVKLPFNGKADGDARRITIKDNNE